MKDVTVELDRGFDSYDLKLLTRAFPEQVVAALLPCPRQTVAVPAGLFTLSWAVHGAPEVAYVASVSGDHVANSPRTLRGLTLWSGRHAGVLDFEVK